MAVQTRIAVRILLLDPKSRVLLFEGRDLADASDTVRFWFTVGGGLEPGEELHQAAIRELREETGQTGIEIVGPFHAEEFDFLNHGEPQHQVEHYFIARTNQVMLDDSGWTGLERRAMTSWRWWTADELLTTDARYFPEDLAQIVQRADALVPSTPRGS